MFCADPAQIGIDGVLLRLGCANIIPQVPGKVKCFFVRCFCDTILMYPLPLSPRSQFTTLCGRRQAISGFRLRLNYITSFRICQDLFCKLLFRFKSIPDGRSVLWFPSPSVRSVCIPLPVFPWSHCFRVMASPGLAFPSQISIMQYLESVVVFCLQGSYSRGDWAVALFDCTGIIPQDKTEVKRNFCIF